MSGAATSTVLRGARLWTAGWSSSRAGELLVVDGRIASVGAPGTLSGDRVEQLDGGLLMPGFQDAHVHPYWGGLALLACDLSAAVSVEDTLARIADHVHRNPGTGWIEGGGWPRHILMLPDRDQLDPVTGDRPAILRSSDCHSVWVNSAALAAAGIDADTPDPANGRIVRDASGRPTGLLDESAIALVERALPARTAAQRQKALLRGEQHLIDHGVTSWQDAIVGTGLGMIDLVDDYVSLLAEGRLSSRVTTALWWDAAAGLEQVADLAQRGARLEAAAGPDTIVADTVKIMLDAAGMMFLTHPQTLEVARALDAGDWSMHFHACGDLAVRQALDAVEDVRGAGAGRGRHQVAHLMGVSDADVPRFAALGVTANVQGAWVDDAPPHGYFPGLGHDAHGEPHLYPYGRLHRAGAELCAGSDWPVSTPDPLDAARAVTRRVDYRTGEDRDEMEDLDLAAYLAAATAGSARINGRGAHTGRLADGHLADLVRLDRDPFAPDGLAQAAAREVWVGGARVRDGS